jgi:hypothetical protein
VIDTIIQFSTIHTFPDKKPRLENVIIYSTKINRNDIKIVKMSVADLWQQGNKVRINNFGDKENKPHTEKVIKQQVSEGGAGGILATDRRNVLLIFL